MPSWFIDSLDARAGVAFASLRDHGLTLGDEALPEAWSVLVEPPWFEPRTISSAALAVAASRGGLQIGLLRNAESEVEFPSLDALREFVRRLYIRGSGGDDAGPEGALTPLPVPDVGPPNLELSEDISESDRDPVRILRMIAAIFQSRDLSIRRAEIEEFLSSEKEADGAASRTVDHALSGPHIARASLILIAELLQRQPRNGDKSEWNRWAVSGSALVSALDRLHVWPLVASDFAYQLRRLVELIDSSIAEDLKRYLGDQGTRENQAAIDALVLRHFLCTGWITPNSDLLALFAQDKVGERQSPAELTELIAIPTEFATNTIQSDRRTEATLHHLLAGYISTPQIVANVVPKMIELILFAAALLASANVRSRTQAYAAELLVPTLTGSRDFALDRARALVESGLRWLADSLPRWTFGRELEEMILDSLALAYRSEQAVFANA